MSDDVGALFEELGRVPIPPGDLGSVVHQGKVRRRRRAAVRIVSLSVVALAVGGTTAILSGQEDRPVPATPDDRGLLESRLLPLILEGPAPGPGPELAPEKERAEARAITVAFHALLDRAPAYDFDYLGVGRTTDGWLVEFGQASPHTALERALARTRARITSRKTELEKRREELMTSIDWLNDRLDDAGRKRKRDFERQRDALQDASGDYRKEVQRAHARLVAVEERMMKLSRRLPASSIMLTVAERDGLVVVEDLTTESGHAGSLRNVVGYAEAFHRVDAWGADYYDLEIRRVDETRVRVRVRQFWTGPLAASYEERCVPQVVDPTGELVWPVVMPRVGYAPAPPTERLRDGEEIELGFPYDGDVSDLSVSMRCLWLPRQEEN